MNDLKLYFITMAPDNIPHWFEPDMEEKGRYFWWRYYYAELMSGILEEVEKLKK